MKRLTVVIAALGLGFSAVTFAQSRCPAGNSGCTMENYGSRMNEIVNDGARDHFSSSSTYQRGVEAARDRVQGAGRIVRECLECATDALQDGMDRVSGGGPSNR